MKKVIRFAILFTLIFSMFFLLTCKGGGGGGGSSSTENGTGDVGDGGGGGGDGGGGDGGGGGGANGLSAPSGLTATTDESYCIYLTWTDNSDNESDFKIEVKCTQAGAHDCTYPSVYTEIDNVGANYEYYRDCGDNDLPAFEGTFCYRIRAYNSEYSSDYSNEACATVND